MDIFQIYLGDLLEKMAKLLVFIVFLKLAYDKGYYFLQAKYLNYFSVHQFGKNISE